MSFWLPTLALSISVVLCWRFLRRSDTTKAKRALRASKLNLLLHKKEDTHTYTWRRCLSRSGTSLWPVNGPEKAESWW